MGDLIRVLVAGVFAVVSCNASAEGWPPEPMIGIQVPVEPTAFPADGRHYLVYELRLTNLAKSASVIRRLEVRDAQSTADAPLASYEGRELDAVLEHFTDPAVGDRMPTPGSGYRALGPWSSDV